MPKERPGTTKIRAVVVRRDYDMEERHEALVQGREVPEHLRGVREEYETATFADEAQKRKAVKRDRTIVEMAGSTTAAALAVSDGVADAVAYVDSGAIRPEQRERVVTVLDEIGMIAHNALLDGLESSSQTVMDIAARNARNHWPAPKARDAKLTWEERVSGRRKADG